MTLRSFAQLVCSLLLLALFQLIMAPAPCAAAEEMKRFENKSFGFTVDYPPNWKELPQKDAKKAFAIYDKDGDIVCTIIATQNDKLAAQTTQSYLDRIHSKKDDLQAALSKKLGPSFVYHSADFSKLGDLPAIRINYSLEIDGKKNGTMLMTKVGALRLDFTCIYPPEHAKTVLPEMDKIISSFKKVDADVTAAPPQAKP